MHTHTQTHTHTDSTVDEHINKQIWNQTHTKKLTCKHVKAYLQIVKKLTYQGANKHTQRHIFTHTNNKETPQQTCIQTNPLSVHLSHTLNQKQKLTHF